MMNLDSLKDLAYDNLYKVASFFQPSDGEASLEYLEKDNRKIYKLIKIHGSQKALDILHKEIRPESEKDPDNWLYLADGYSDEISLFMPETTYVFTVAKKLSIPVIDPVIFPYSKECLDYIIFTKGLDEKETHLAIIIDMYPYQKENTLDFINKICKINMNADYFNECLTKLNELAAKQDPKNVKDFYHAFSEQLYEASRELSKNNIRKILQTSNKSKILLMTDPCHKDII